LWFWMSWVQIPPAAPSLIFVDFNSFRVSAT
jgi:hypothetical protein